MRAIKPRRREALDLGTLGYSYTEIMRLTGRAYAAVDRRITRLRRPFASTSPTTAGRAGSTSPPCHAPRPPTIMPAGWVGLAGVDSCARRRFDVRMEFAAPSE